MELRSLRRGCWVAALTAGLVGWGGLAARAAAQNAPDQAGAAASATPTTPATVNGLPVWAYATPPSNGRRGGGFRGGPGGARRGPGGPGGAGGRRGPDNTTPEHVPGSTQSYTAAQVANLYNVPDWFPDSHPPMPDVVAHGNQSEMVQACGYCHLPDGLGRPENESIAGLPEGYILQQLSDFKNGLRKSSDPRMGSVAGMVRIAQHVNPDEAQQAAAYFSALQLTPWIEVKEASTVPVTRPQGGMMVAVPNGGTEPIGNRVIEVSKDQELTELRDTQSGFIAYVPPGSIAAGKDLVTTGGNGATIPCAICHGDDLHGLGNVPHIAGRSPAQMARQLIDIQTGARNGPWTQLMKAPVKNLTETQIVDIVAYLASLQP